NTIWGNKESVLVGDFIFSRAFELMVAAKNLRVLQILSNASGVIAEGEVLQLATQKNMQATFDMYLAVVEAKTAALFSAAARAGSVIASADETVENSLSDYGRYLGVAFQMIDDALDYAGTDVALGKNVGDDFREGKMTAPVVFALDRADDNERKFWRRVIAEGDQRPDDFAQAMEIINANGALEDTFACARQYIGKALSALDAAPSNIYADALAELARQSLTRAN
ncbi:MAG: polyprenyl synthetase family protein, partial [Pseudomonadota bacterium]